MEMLSGKRVLDYLNMVNEQNRQISVKLSAKMDSISIRTPSRNFTTESNFTIPISQVRVTRVPQHAQVSAPGKRTIRTHPESSFLLLW